MRGPSISFVRYLIWIPVAVFVVIAASQIGKVHVIWSYSWRAAPSASYGDFDARHYTRCSYISFKGTTITEHPLNGRCGWLRFGTGTRGAAS